MPGQVIWITGASSGIGRALARRFADNDCVIAVSARREAELNKLADECRHLPGRISVFPLDVTDCDGLKRTIGEIETSLGPINLAVLNAGSFIQDGIDEDLPKVVRQSLQSNFLPACDAISILLPGMASRRQGHIAVVASVAGYRGLPGTAGYSASKSAVIRVMESLREPARACGVKLQLINPGWVDTPLAEPVKDYPKPFMISPENAAKHIARGLRSRRFEITFPKPFTWSMKLLRLLPYGLFFAVSSRLRKHDRNRENR